MGWFKNFRTRTKLLFGFGLMSALLIGLAIVSYRTITDIETIERGEVTDSNAADIVLRELRSDQNRIRGSMLGFIAFTDTTERTAYKRDIEERAAEIEKGMVALDTYLTKLDLPDEDAKLPPLQMDLADYRLVREEQFGLVAAGRIAEALALSAGAQTERFERIRATMISIGEGLKAHAQREIANAKSLFNRAIWILIVIGAIAVLFSLFMIWQLTRQIAVPLQMVTDIANRIAMGDLGVELEAANRSDEIGALQGAFRTMVGKLRSFATTAERIAAGDLTVQLESAAGSDETDMLERALRVMVEKLREMNHELREGFSILASSSTEIFATVSQVAASATETATAVSETSTTAEEVKQTAHLSNQKAKAVQESAQKAVSISESGRKAVAETIEGMNRIREQMESIAESVVRLSEQGQAIGEIIATVNDLAEQSNLLAVNAAIEATRAGESGKAFAVVAQEVKSLAEQSRQATTQVRTILMEVQKATSAAVMATEQGSKAVAAGVLQATEAGASIGALTGSVGESAQAAIQIAASSQQQLVGMDQIALAISNIQQATSQNMAGTKQLEASARGLQELGGRLKILVERQKVEG